MYRKGISALILNRKNKILVVNLVAFQEHYFAIPGGGQEIGETLEETAYREIKEELGIDASLLRYRNKNEKPLIFQFENSKVSKDGSVYIGSERHFFVFDFLGSDSDIKVAQDEVRAYKWASFSELDKYLLFKNQLIETKDKIIEILGDTLLD